MKQTTTFLIALIMFVGHGLLAQMPHDALYMSKNTTCVALVYGQSTWSEYWEGSLKRENFNIGTHTTQSMMLMGAVGVTDRLNVMVGLPYVSTKTSAGNLMGQNGLQDVSGWVKYKFYESPNGLSLHGVVGGSVPVSNYVADFLPMSIGLGAKSATGRIMANYLSNNGLYLTGRAAYTYRSNIKVDRDAYQANGRVYNTNEVFVPNAMDYGLQVGYLKGALQVELFADRFTCVEGDNIRRNDMPFPTNNMQATTVGAYAKFQPKNWGLNLRASQVVDGLNVGKSLNLSMGVLYQFSFAKKQAGHTVHVGMGHTCTMKCEAPKKAEK
jgi:hypothetical protein